MSRTRILALARRIVLQFRRDRRTLVLLIVVPSVVLTLLASVFRLETAPISLAIVNQETAPIQTPLGPVSLAERLGEAFKDSETFVIVELSEEEARQQVLDGKLKAALVFPADFTEQVLAGQQVQVDLLLEGSNPQTNGAVLGRLSGALPKALLEMAPVGPGQTSSARLPVELKPIYFYGGEEFDTFDYFAPVMIAIFSFFFVFLLTVVSFLRERAQGTMERLLASPLTRMEIVLGYMFGFFVFALLPSLGILLFAIYALQIHYVGEPWIVLLVIVLLTIGAVNLGIFLSTFARNELQAVQFIPLVIVPQILLSAVFWPIEDMPEFLQWIAYALPLTYSNIALRDVMLKGYGLGEGSVPLSLLGLVAFAVGMVVLASLTLRREVA